MGIGRGEKVVTLFKLLRTYRFYTYGDFPLALHLEQIESEILQHFTTSSPSLSVPLEPRWSGPVSLWKYVRTSLMCSVKYNYCIA